MEDKKKTGEETPKEKKVVVKSVSDEFMEELDEQEKAIFLQLKSVLMDKCELLEFEAVNEDNLDDFATLITYVKNGVVSVLVDGVEVNLRRPIKNKDGDVLTNSVTVLFDRNEAREKTFTNRIKIKKNDIESQKEFTRASLAASLKNVDVLGVSKMLSSDSLKDVHTKDYLLLLTCYNFFRN